MSRATAGDIAQIDKIPSKIVEMIYRHEPFVVTPKGLFSEYMPELSQYVVYLGSKNWPILIYNEIMKNWFHNEGSSTVGNNMNILPIDVRCTPDRMLNIAERGAAVFVTEKIEGAING